MKLPEETQKNPPVKKNVCYIPTDHTWINPDNKRGNTYI